jgi:hypothetical protein
MAAGGSGCTASGGVETAVVVTTGLQMNWEVLPHRPSRFEATAEPLGSSSDFKVTFQNDGGSFGSIDSPVGELEYQRVRSADLRAVFGSREIEIDAGQTSASAQVVVEGARSGEMALAVLRGFRLSSDEYGTPPSFSAVYDPALGWTTQGFGVVLELGEATSSATTLTLTVTNRWAACDRGDPTKQDDMNGTVAQAKAWLRVDYTVLFLREGRTTRSEKSYFVSYSSYGVKGMHATVPAAAERKAVIKGDPGSGVGFLAITGFDFLSNDPLEKDPNCEIKAKPECVGPGRYLRTMRGRLGSPVVDSTTGEGTADVDLFFSNDSPDDSKPLEEGSMCVRARMNLVLVQLPTGVVGEVRTVKTDTKFKSGAAWSTVVAE